MLGSVGEWLLSAQAYGVLVRLEVAALAALCVTCKGTYLKGRHGLLPLASNAHVENAESALS